MPGLFGRKCLAELLLPDVDELLDVLVVEIHQDRIRPRHWPRKEGESADLVSFDSRRADRNS